MKQATPAMRVGVAGSAAPAREYRRRVRDEVDDLRYWPLPDKPSGKCAMCVRGLGPHVCFERKVRAA